MKKLSVAYNYRYILVNLIFNVFKLKEKIFELLDLLSRLGRTKIIYILWRWFGFFIWNVHRTDSVESSDNFSCLL